MLDAALYEIKALTKRNKELCEAIEDAQIVAGSDLGSTTAREVFEILYQALKK